MINELTADIEARVEKRDMDDRELVMVVQLVIYWPNFCNSLDTIDVDIVNGFCNVAVVAVAVVVADADAVGSVTGGHIMSKLLEFCVDEELKISFELLPW